MISESVYRPPSRVFDPAPSAISVTGSVVGAVALPGGPSCSASSVDGGVLLVGVAGSAVTTVVVSAAAVVSCVPGSVVGASVGVIPAGVGVPGVAVGGPVVSVSACGVVVGTGGVVRTLVPGFGRLDGSGLSAGVGLLFSIGPLRWLVGLRWCGVIVVVLTRDDGGDDAGYCFASFVASAIAVNTESHPCTNNDDDEDEEPNERPEPPRGLGVVVLVRGRAFVGVPGRALSMIGRATRAVGSGRCRAGSCSVLLCCRADSCPRLVAAPPRDGWTVPPGCGAGPWTLGAGV